MFLFVLQHYFFYATGHETAFIHIRWESGFHGFFGDNNNVIVRLIMAILILINTNSGIFITSVFFVIFLTNQVKNCRICLTYLLKLCLLNSIKVFFRNLKEFNISFFKCKSCIFLKIFSSSLSVYILRRHLMVWKLFAPRFVFDAIGLVLGYIFILLDFIIFYSQ